MLSFLLCFISSKVQLGLTEERQFLQWMRTNNKMYVGDDYHLRLGIFISNARYCQQFNKRKDRTFTVGINKFSCHTPAEYKSILGGHLSQTTKLEKSTISKSTKTAPDSLDWREKGIVNPIKDQGSCGSCWAFSTITTSEGAYALTSGQLLQFSEQNLVDCVKTCYGCNGGWQDKGLDYILQSQNGQFNTEADYPYTAQDGKCSYQPEKAIGKITKYVKIESGNEDDLKEKVATYGVVAISISAGNTPFMAYWGGILDDDSCLYVDHAVATVGYGSEDGVDFWIVRNSWGTTWGEQGYCRMIRNKNNKCFVASSAFVAIDSE